MSEYDMSNEFLVKGCKKKDTKAQKQLYDKYSSKMMGVCLRYSDNVEEAEDVLQNGFIKVFESINKFRGEGSLEGWIRKIMVNSALDNIRRKKARKTNLQLEEVEYKYAIEDTITGKLDSKVLLKMINTLPVGFRTVFNLYAIEGYTHKEIAQQLGISENTSKSQYSRARLHLQKMIKHENVFE